MGDDRRVVYITGAGRVKYCARCGAPEGQCACQATRAVARAPRDGFVRIARERKGRGGKIVTTINGIAASPDELDALAQTLKRLCGAGGTVRDGVIELQGDLRERAERKLIELGYKIKRVGG